MNEKQLTRVKILKALYPPVLYAAISMFVQVIAQIIIYYTHAKSIGKDKHVNFLDSYQYLDKIEELLEKYNYVILFCSAFIAMIIFGFIYFKDCEQNNEGNLSDQIEKVGKIDFLLLAGLGIFGNLGLSRLVSLLPLDNIIGNYEKTQKAILSGNLIIQIITVAIIIPITEEIIYRGLVFSRLQKIIDKRVAILIASVIFGIFHFNLLQGVYAFLLSVILIYVYVKYHSILSCILIHAFANLTAVLTSYTGISDILSKNLIIYIIMMIIEMIITGILFEIIVNKR